MIQQTFELLISLLKSNNLQLTEGDFYIKLNDFCKKNPTRVIELLQYRKEGKSLLHFALDSKNERVFSSIFCLYKTVLNDWQSLILLDFKIVSNDIFWKEVFSIYPTAAEFAQYGNKVLNVSESDSSTTTAAASAAIPASDNVSRTQFSTDRIKLLKKIPYVILLKLWFLKSNDPSLRKNKSQYQISLEDIKQYFTQPEMQNYWEQAYQDLVRKFFNNSDFIVNNGDWLPGDTPFESVVSLYLFYQHSVLIQIKKFYNRVAIDAFSKVVSNIDSLVRTLEDIAIVQYSSFHMLHYLCGEMLNNISSLKPGSIRNDNIAHLLQLIKKLQNFEAPGYLSSAALYLTIGNHYKTIEANQRESNFANLYYKKSYEALLVAEKINGSARQIEVAFFGKSFEFIYQIPSYEVAKKALKDLLKLNPKEYAEIEKIANETVINLNLKKPKTATPTTPKVVTSEVTTAVTYSTIRQNVHRDNPKLDAENKKINIGTRVLNNNLPRAILRD